MPVSYGDSDADFERLMNAASQWDFAVQRQVEIRVPDAARLVQIVSVRDLSGISVDEGMYVPMFDHRGVLINNPVALKLDEDQFWLSTADNNVLMWVRAIASERGLRAVIIDPHVSPMAVQGPKAENVVAATFGDWVREIRFFWFVDAERRNSLETGALHLFHARRVRVLPDGRFSRHRSLEHRARGGPAMGHRAWLP